MNRITYKNPDGTWGIKGLEWNEIPETLQKKLYGAFCKLRDYENTGLDVRKLEEIDRLYQEQCRELKEY